VNEGMIWPTTSWLTAAICSGLQITFAIQDGSTKNDGSNKRADAATMVEDDSCQFNQYFGNSTYALTLLYRTGKGMPPAQGGLRRPILKVGEVKQWQRHWHYGIIIATIVIHGRSSAARQEP
jgi:hypothetical protein